MMKPSSFGDPIVCIYLFAKPMGHRPEAPNRKRLLDQGAALLRRSDESAFSIVPSRMSYLTQDRFSYATDEGTELNYRELDVDDDLFTSRVYKRNYRNPRMVYEQKEQEPVDQTVQRVIPTLDDETGTRKRFFSTTKQQRQVRTMTALERQGIIGRVSTRKLHLKSSPTGDFAQQSNWSIQNRLSVFSSSGESCASMEDAAGACGGYTSISEAQWLVHPIEYPYVLGPSPVNQKFSVEGPAVSLNLRANGDPSAHLSIRRSVGCSSAEDLKTLLVHIGASFADWRKLFFLEACLQKRTALVQLLLGCQEWGTSAGRESDRRGGFAEIIKAFLIWGIRHCSNVIEQHWLLHSAVAVNREDVVDFLIEEGAQVNHPDKHGLQPLHLACMRGNIHCVKSLIAAGARLDCEDFQGHQPMHILGIREAVDTQDVAAILDVILLAGSSIDNKTAGGQTLLQLACLNRKPYVLKAALLYGASRDPSSTDPTLLRLACQEGDSGIVNTLLTYHRAADVCDPGTVGESPLSLAIRYGQGTVVQRLIHKAFDLEVRGAATLGPIYQACKKHNLPIIERLENHDDPFIIGNLLAHGPLLPLGESCISWQSPRERSSKPGFAHDF